MGTYLNVQMTRKAIPQLSSQKKQLKKVVAMKPAASQSSSTAAAAVTRALANKSSIVGPTIKSGSRLEKYLPNIMGSHTSGIIDEP